MENKISPAFGEKYRMQGYSCCTPSIGCVFFIISHRLGHTTTEQVERTYGHLTKGLEKKASHQFSELIRDLHI